ncbi:hypothetical protein WICPIJ_004124 [Wickerhamomyces pijperi]|uniref:Uncharacterized protein n=1 Tax=Wickerhamomyces pijperi TaxID=599730 RepID=A0A9P8Q8A8_WICPI|nr:hypothetical protein WICPIJ_004124 [Wickerhamomyces pijperi]
MLATPLVTEQAEHLGLGWSNSPLDKNLSLASEAKMALVSLKASGLLKIPKDNKEEKPAMKALVVATAGIMLPAMDLISNLDFNGMLKMWDLMLVDATTKSKVSSSSLSNSIGVVAE